MNWAAINWLLLMVIFLIVEAACPIHLVSIWFAVGALAATIASGLNGPLWLQITLFLVVSGGLLIALWPFVRKFLNPGHSATNVDSIIGSQGYVTAAIDNLNAVGQVKLGGMYWTARSTAGTPIPQGTLIQVDRIEGVKVFVSAAEAPIPAQTR
jgi:membrane protein implicated in regulation of membrane protease activity